jgi:hypothetical protein
MRTKTAAIAVVLSLIGVVMLTPGVLAPVPETWHTGDEYAITGHNFTEEYWTADISNTSGGATTTMTMSYVNHDDAQAFLLAFKTYEKEGNVSTLPYQMFGMHYKSPDNRDMFIGAVLAFLMAFDDTYNRTGPGENGMPDPGHENVYYIIPFGVGGTLTNGSYVPDVTSIPAQKIGEGHYRFGMRYRNMYAKVIDANNPWALLLSTAYPLYIAKFSELSITYDIKYGADNTLTAETYYVLGQVTKLWLWGIEVDPRLIPDNWGIAAVHYVAMFGSTYLVSGNQTGHTIDTGIRHPIGEDMNLKVGNPPRRVFDVGFRGKFDLINETSGVTVRSGDDARNLIVKATLVDSLLVAWQGAFSLGVMATMAYALSPDLQSRYSGPLDLFQHAGSQFLTSTLWYAVSFPRWDGYRVEHDPVYTAYMAAPTTTPNLAAIFGLMVLVLIIVMVVVVIVAVASRRKTKVPPPPYV